MLRAPAFLFVILMATGAWGGFGYILFREDPGSDVNRALFFLSLFVALLGSASLAAYGLSFRVFSLRRHQGWWGSALLQGLPLALVVSAAVWLQSLRVLTLGMGIVLVAMLGLAEFLTLYVRGR
ncbi:MAG: hypothetical protein HYU86_02150 [Chloroflexi bacterium]|nr:hypothetical protein [Chloroflexota bacterium]